MINPEQVSNPRFDSDTSRQYGNKVLGALNMAVEKHARLRRAEAKVERRTATIQQANCLRRPMLTAWLRADDIRAHRQTEYKIRREKAEAYVASDIELSVYDFDGEALASGVLKHVDYAAAELALETAEGESTVLDFSHHRQLPEPVSERYFGHEPTIQLRVDAISEAHSQIFEPPLPL